MRPHRTDGISLSFGLVFLLVAIWWAIAQVVTVHLPAAGWLVAGGLILFGAIGLLGAIRSGRRTEVPAPVQAEAQVETPGDLPPEMHADIVRELLDNPADRVDLHPAYLKHPVSSPPAAAPAAPASAPPAPKPEETDEPTAEVTRVDLGADGDPDGAPQRS
ncbi:phage holin family protein [Actinoplanes sp. NPDC049599]|uniref:phage holin family protein n=1 Tax=Actinoplanes sp. NPDC049599 TaxID=3363903 RepID=UPI00379C7137